MAESLVEQEVRRDQALGAGSSDARQLAIELPRIGLKARKIGLRVRRVVDLMLGVEEARHVEIGADVLDHDVGRVAPAADGDVAVGEGEAFERRRVGALHDFHAGARRMVERGRVDGIGAGEIGTDRLRNTLLASGRAVGELGTERGMLALVDA